MAAYPDRPIIFLDVDGTLIPFGSIPGSRGKPTRHTAGSQQMVSDNPLLDRLNPEDGPRLRELGCELVWATTWMAEANVEICPRLGLPALPVVGWSDAADEPLEGLHWKTQDLVSWAAGRPFIWLDDEIRATDRDWVATHHTAPALLHHVDPNTGLSSNDFSRIRQWLSAQ